MDKGFDREAVRAEVEKWRYLAPDVCDYLLYMVDRADEYGYASDPETGDTFYIDSDKLNGLYERLMN